jgi:hypothetical protein
LTAVLEPGAEVKRVVLNGRTVDFDMEREDVTRCAVQFAVTGKDEVRLEILPGLRIAEPLEEAPIGERSRQIRILRTRWDRATGDCIVEVEGRSGTKSEMELLGPPSVEQRRIQIEFPPGPGHYVRRTLRIALHGQNGRP